jgi:hypothetical protein
VVPLIATLRAKMVNNHPERGGKVDDFVAARAEYIVAKRVKVVSS